MQIKQTSRPWYKEFWAWFCVVILLFAVILGLGLLYFASNNPPSMVVDNYYDVGKGINRSLERERFAERLGQRVNLTLMYEKEQAELQLTGSSLPAHLVLNLISPTQPERDVRIVMQPVNTTGLYRGLLTQEVAGKRYVELLGQHENQDWRLYEEEFIVSGQAIQLGAEMLLP